MTASRRYLPASLACLLTLSAGSAGLASGGFALDPYASVSAPTSLQGAKKGSKGKKNKHIPIVKKAQAEEKIVQDDSTQSQTYVKMPGKDKAKKQKETALGPDYNEPKVAKKAKAQPVQTTTKVSDVAPAPKKQKTAAVAKEQKTAAAPAKSDDSVMGGIKTIGEGYSKTFKAASHGVVHSTKAASDAVLAGSKKMSSGIKSSAKASGDVFKKGADIVSHGFKATGDKIKEGAAPITHKLAKAPAPAKATANASAPATASAPAPKDTKLVSDNPKGNQSLVSKLTHLPKPKMPKIGIPFVGGKKKPAVVDTQAGANDLGAPAIDTNVAAAPKKTPVVQAPKQTPVVDTPLQTAQTPAASKVKTTDKLKGAGQSLAAIPGNVSKQLGKLWPFGHKNAPAAQSNPSSVAGKATQPPM